MKHTILSFLTFAFIALGTNAQIVVEENGNTAIGYEGNGTALSPLSVNSQGSTASTVSIYGEGREYALSVHKDNIGMSNYNVGIYSTINVASSGYSCGLYSIALPYGNTSTGSACGVYGLASGGANGRNYGVGGTINGTGYGTGIYASSTNGDLGITMSSRYAGYFRGNVYVTGTINGYSISSLSDYRLKENITPLAESPLTNIQRMNVVEFNYKQREVEGLNGKENLYEEDSPVLTHRHYGLIAQELQEIYPDLVVEGDDGYLAVNYVEIIPLLIQSIQELSAKLEAAEKSTEHRGETTAFNATEAIETALFQNTPNPFTETTVIPCAVAEGVAQAVLYVYNLNGEQIAEYPIASRGNTEVTIVGNSLKAGMYLYSLIADGKVIDTKRMILTK